METVRELLNILIVATALFVIVKILASDLAIRAVRNPLITLIMGFLVTTILWLAWLGVSAVFTGYNSIEISSSAMIALVLFALVIAAGFFTPANMGKFLVFLFAGAWIVAIGILAVIGLSLVDAWYVQDYVLTWLIVSLGVTLFIQICLRIIDYRRNREP